MYLYLGDIKGWHIGHPEVTERLEGWGEILSVGTEGVWVKVAE